MNWKISISELQNLKFLHVYISKLVEILCILLHFRWILPWNTNLIYLCEISPIWNLWVWLNTILWWLKILVSFSDVYEDDGFVHFKIKRLTLICSQKKTVNTDLFFRMRNSFSNLDKLEIQSKFPISSNFFYELIGNIHFIKSLTIGSFSIRNVEKFPDTIIEVLKHLQKNLEF